MQELNTFQREFMKILATIQESCVLTALCLNYECSLEHKFYNITADVMIRIMELIDGYTNADIGRLKVICEKSNDSLKENPHIELHDVICDYLKYTK